MEVVNNFGPPLVKLTANQHLLDIINSYADQVLSKENSKKSLYAGDFPPDVISFIMEAGMSFYKRFAILPKKNDKLAVSEMWVVSQKKETWNYLHSRTGYISGIIFLRTQNDSAVEGGITFAQGTPGMFHKAAITLKPVAGDVFLFPTHLLHNVYPFSVPEDQPYFSFNLSLIKGDDSGSY